MKEAAISSDASLEQALAELHVDGERGLTADEVVQRRATYGSNTIEEKTKNPLLRLLAYFWDRFRGCSKPAAC